MSIRSFYAANCRWRPAKPFIGSARGKLSSLAAANGCVTVLLRRKVRNTLPSARLLSHQQPCIEMQNDVEDD